MFERLQRLRAIARTRVRGAARAAARRLLAPSTVDWLASALPGLARRPIASVELPPGRRVLVLAPHADDEVIGCGGTLARYVASGASVHVAVMTDGSQAGDALRQLAPGSAERARTERELAVTRKAEAAAAARELGIGELRFLDGPDGALDPTDGALLRRLEAVLEASRPDIVLLPFLTDRHTDHIATNDFLMAVYDERRLPWLDGVLCCGYEVWTPLPANLAVDITAQMDAKRRALAHYVSQVSRLDYESAAVGMNRFRAFSTMRGEYAEAFHLAPIAEYRRLYQLLRA